MKKRKVLAFVAIVLISANAYSQASLEERIKYEEVIFGTIIKEGKEVQGYIKKMGSTWSDGKTFIAPWQFQSDIKFVPKEVFESNEKIKNKLYESYSAKDIDGYLYEDFKYESVKYADMSAVGTGMIAKKMFMRKISDGKITLYHYFNSPPAVVAGETFDQYYIDCAKPNLVYRVGAEGKLKLVNDLNINKELADCPMVVQKHEKGEYKVAGKEGGEESSGVNKLLNNAVFREDVRLQAIEDYNTNCK